MPTYDSTQFDPPASVATVSLRAPNHDKVVANAPMLIDTGADLTLIPERFISELEVELGENHAYELEGFDGRKIVTRSIQLELVFLDEPLEDVSF